MSRLTSNEDNTSNGRQTQTLQQTTILFHFNTHLDQTHIDSNPLLKSLYDQVNSIVQQSPGQDVAKIFFAVLSAIDNNLSNPNSPLSMNPDLNHLRQLYGFLQNGRTESLTLNLLRPSQQLATSSSPPPEEEPSSTYSHRFDSDLLPPPPETWSDTDMTFLIDQAINAEEMSETDTPPFYSAYGAYR